MMVFPEKRTNIFTVLSLTVYCFFFYLDFILKYFIAKSKIHMVLSILFISTNIVLNFTNNKNVKKKDSKKSVYLVSFITYCNNN